MISVSTIINDHYNFHYRRGEHRTQCCGNVAAIQPCQRENGNWPGEIVLRKYCHKTGIAWQQHAVEQQKNQSIRCVSAAKWKCSCINCQKNSAVICSNDNPASKNYPRDFHSCHHNPNENVNGDQSHWIVPYRHRIHVICNIIALLHWIKHPGVSWFCHSHFWRKVFQTSFCIFQLRFCCSYSHSLQKLLGLGGSNLVEMSQKLL